MLCRECYSGLQADGTCKECDEYFARIREQSARERNRPASFADNAAGCLFLTAVGGAITCLLFLLWKAITE